MIKRTFFGFVSLVLSCGWFFAQEMTLESLLQKHFEAKGGLEKIKSIKSARMGGRLTMGPGNEAPFKLLFKRPQKIRTEFMVQGMIGIQAYDGTSSWAVLPFMGIEEPRRGNENQDRRLRKQADLDGPLVDWKQKGNLVELAGTAQVEGKEAFKIRVVESTGEMIYLYIASDSYLSLKQESTTVVDGKETKVETFFRDYQSVEGIRMPHLVETRTSGSVMTQRTKIFTIELNVEISDALFQMP